MGGKRKVFIICKIKNNMVLEQNKNCSGIRLDGILDGRIIISTYDVTWIAGNGHGRVLVAIPNQSCSKEYDPQTRNRYNVRTIITQKENSTVYQ